jgi:transcription elongation factor Elf1
MALPKLDSPVYEIDLPLSKKHIRFRPFLVKEQRNLLMAMESDEKETIEKNIKQILHNCTLTENIDIDSLPILDVEFYFLNLRARSVGEIVTNKYRCENIVDDKVCGSMMESEVNLLDIKVDMSNVSSDTIQLTDKVSIKLKYPEYSVITSSGKFELATDMAFNMILHSIEHIFDGEQYFYARETDPSELNDFIESLNQEQFSKIENFFNNLPKMTKMLDMTCKKCGFQHHIEVEGLEDFFA